MIMMLPRTCVILAAGFAILSLLLDGGKNDPPCILTHVPAYGHTYRKLPLVDYAVLVVEIVLVCT